MRLKGKLNYSRSIPLVTFLVPPPLSGGFVSFLVPNADHEDAAHGVRDRNIGTPFEGWSEAFCLSELGLANQEGESASRRDQTSRDGESGIEALDCAECHDVCRRVGEVLGAAGEHIDARQCKLAGDLAQEGCLLLIGLDQGQVDVGPPDFYWKPREAGA